MIDKARVHGDRICQQCKGLCHEKAWRQQIGRRKSYWCDETCLRRHLNEGLRESCREVGCSNWREIEYDDEDYREMRDEFYEPVAVIAP